MPGEPLVLPVSVPSDDDTSDVELIAPPVVVASPVVAPPELLPVEVVAELDADVEVDDEEDDSVDPMVLVACPVPPQT